MVTQNIIDNFCQYPEQFMRSNSVKWRGTGPEDQAIIDVAMIDIDHSLATNPYARIRTGSQFLGMGNKKANANRYDIRIANNPLQPLAAGTITFSVHWSGYRAGQSRTAILPAAGGPDIMLTPELTGCTIVYKSNVDGSAQFSHYNMKVGNETLDDDAMRAHAAGEYGHGHTTLTKGDYRAMGKRSQAVCSTVVGIRRGGQWEFYAQIREDKASGEQIRSVRRL